MKWIIEIRREDDEVVVLVGRDGKFYDEAGFHPSEADWCRWVCELCDEEDPDTMDACDSCEECEDEVTRGE